MNIIDTKVGENNNFPANIVLDSPIGVNELSSLDKVFLISKPSKEEKGVFNTHLSVKPVNLLEHLITLYTMENAVVLDPFMGSGSTAVAAISCNRKYIGFDINPEYIDICHQRIENIKKITTK